MNHSYLTSILMAAGFILLFVIWILHENRKNQKQLLQKIRNAYGKPSQRRYEPGHLDKISHYYKRIKEDRFYIDDITWNDLDLDSMYMMVNQTISSPGEDVLYSMMRLPVFSKEEADKREDLIQFFAASQQKRERLLQSLAKISKNGAGSLSDTVLALKDAPRVHTGIHAVLLLVLLASLVLLPFSPVYGFFFLLIIMITNVVVYYAGRDRKLIEAYLICFSQLIRMLSAADELEPVDWPEIKEQMDGIREGRKAFHKIRKRSVFITGSNGAGDGLQVVMDYVRMLTHVDILVYNSLLDQVQGKTGQILQMIQCIGELDAAISIASFREMLSYWCRPEFLPYTTAQPVSLEAADLYHPLLTEAVANSIQAKGGTLVTGSNASGKSTFLKNVALNSILAQTLLTCTCSCYKAPFLKVMTSMALRDDLSGGESYFIVEIKSLKRILDEGKKEVPLLCIIDEVLRGTNTIERIAASSQILNALDKKWILPFAATHDIELSYILNGVYENYHFQEEVREHEVVFDYILRKGRATTRNAIRLLDMLGYDPKIVKAAGMAAENFERTGVWRTIN